MMLTVDTALNSAVQAAPTLLRLAARPVALAPILALPAHERLSLAVAWACGAIELQRTDINTALVFRLSRTAVNEAKNGGRRSPSVDPLARAWARATAEQRAAFLQAHADTAPTVLEDATAPVECRSSALPPIHIIHAAE